jgi:hypothetical protein
MWPHVDAAGSVELVNTWATRERGEIIKIDPATIGPVTARDGAPCSGLLHGRRSALVAWSEWYHLLGNQ